MYRERLKRAGIAVDETLIRHCGHLMKNGYLEAQVLLDLPHPPTAIWAINDILAISALRATLKRNARKGTPCSW